MNTQAADSIDQDLLLGQIATEFFERLSRGETPQVDEYVQRHPELAQMIRHALPALQMVNDSLAGESGRGQPVGGYREKRLGDFRILHELGRGGMGVVYEAEQLSMGGRKVALKVLPFAAMVDEKRLQRFRNEVRAAASLDHPNIVSVYSVGEERGVHFYAMQLIRGQSLASLIEQLRDLRLHQHPLDNASLSNALSTPRNGQTPSTVCEPTQEFQSASAELSDSPSVHPGARSPTSDTAAGVQGLVSTKGNPRRSEYFQSIAELGIQAAEALDHAHQLGVVHRDIKPANLMIDAKAKLYITDFGLAQMEENAGITLTGDIVGTLRYMSPEQALGNRVAVDHRADIYALGVSLYELLITEPAFDGENRAALLKQIAFQEPRRLRQMDRTIPQDLETIIHKAIAKNPDERYVSAQQLADDLRAFHDNLPIKARPPSIVDRSRKWTYRNQGLVLAIGGVLLLTTIGLGIANQLLSQERTRADREADMARNEAAITAAVNEFLNTDLLGAANPMSEPNRELKVRDLLERAARNVQHRFSDQPLVAAAIHRTLGTGALALGEFQLAEQQLNLAKQSYQQLQGDDHHDTLLVDQELAKLSFERAEYTECKKRYQSILERAVRTRGTEDAIALSSRSGLAGVLREEGKYQAAEQELREVLEIQRRVLGAEHPDALLTMSRLGAVMSQLARYAEAERMTRELLDIYLRLYGAVHPRTLRTKMTLALVLDSVGKKLDAEKLDREVLDSQRLVLGPKHPDTLLTAYNLSCSMLNQGRFAETEQFCQEIVDTLLDLYGSEHRLTLACQINQANAICQLGRPAEGEKIYREVLEVQRRVLGPEHPSTLATMRDLGNTFLDQRDCPQAEKLYREVIAVQRRVLGPEHPDTLRTTHGLVAALLHQNRFADAEELSRELLEIERRVLGAEHGLTLGSVLNLANSVASQGRYAEAEQLNRKLLEVQTRALGEEHPSTLSTMHNLAFFLGVSGRKGEAEQINRPLLATTRRVLGAEHPQTLKPMHNLALNLAEQGKWSEAEPLFREEFDLRRRVFGLSDTKTQAAMHNLVLSLRKIERSEDGLSLTREILDLAEQELGKNHPTTVLYRKTRVIAITNGAWDLATDVDPHRRSPERALVYAREATELEPEKPNHWSNLGVALNAASEFEEAIEAFEKSDELRGEPDLEHRLFFAQALWQSGKKELARERFQEGTKWVREKSPSSKAYQRFLTETEAIMQTNLQE